MNKHNLLESPTSSSYRRTPEWVRKYGSGLFPSDDQARSIVVDGSHNIYITGTSDSTFTGIDYVTVKYDSNGTPLWTRRYDGPDSFDDIPSSIGVDAANSVYLTGSSHNASGHGEFCTLKYDSNGVQQWVARYAGPGDLEDDAAALAIDPKGNVLVTGYGIDGVTFGDVITIKYDGDGKQIWSARFNGAGNGYDAPSAMTIDTDGNTYVAGRTIGPTGNDDFLTLKYDSSGVEKWAVAYNDTGNSDDIALAISLDRSGNVYVTGHGGGAGTGLDILTVKYNKDGIRQWVSRYNGQANSDDTAVGMVIDDSANVYVAGRTTDASVRLQFVTIKYDSGGNELWSRQYQGPIGSVNLLVAITADSQRNLYVIGSSNVPDSGTAAVIIKYSRAGEEVWTSRYTGSTGSDNQPLAVALDHGRGVYSTGGTHTITNATDFLTLKYTLDGTFRWAAQHGGSGTSKETASAFAVDRVGNLAIVGESASGGGSFFTTLAYDSGGSLRWSSHYQPVASSFTTPWSLHMQPSGNVYVVGVSTTPQNDTPYTITIKYDSLGSRQWTEVRSGAQNYINKGNVMAIDDAGDVVITTSAVDSADYTTVKYNTTGEELWEAHYSLSSGSFNGSTALTIDKTDNIYVTGSSMGDFATLKYSPTGVQRWVARYHDSSALLSVPRAITIDGAGGVYVTGYSGVSQSADFLTVKYDSNGNQLWASRYNGDGNGADRAMAIALDDSDNVIITGSSTGNGTGRDYATLKYSADGSLLWVALLDDALHRVDDAKGVAVDNAGEIYVSGESYSEGGNPALVTVKYAGIGGSPQWTATETDIHTTAVTNLGVFVDQLRNAYIGGYSVASNGRWGVFTVVKYGTSPTGVSEPPGKPHDLKLEANYPNPFNPSTSIRYYLPSDGHVVISIFDALGREVRSLCDAEEHAGWKSLTFQPSGLASGVYFLRLTFATKQDHEVLSRVEKMIYLR